MTTIGATTTILESEGGVEGGINILVGKKPHNKKNSSQPNALIKIGKKKYLYFQNIIDLSLRMMKSLNLL